MQFALRSSALSICACICYTDRVYQMSTPAFGTNPAKTKTYGYDSNGNCTSVGVTQSGTTQTTALAYDVENRLTGITYPSASTDTYAYNGNGMRTKKTDSGGTFNYICDGTTPGSDVLSDGAATYTPGISERRNVGGTATSAFYHNDGDGSVGTVTSASQSVTSSKKYDAFGNVVPASGSGSGPFVPAPMTPVYPFGFKGAQQAQTDSSGLILQGDRYYDSDLGRYLSGDYSANCIGGPDPDPMPKVVSDFGRKYEIVGDVNKLIIAVVMMACHCSEEAAVEANPDLVEWKSESDAIGYGTIWLWKKSLAQKKVNRWSPDGTINYGKVAPEMGAWIIGTKTGRFRVGHAILGGADRVKGGDPPVGATGFIHIHPELPKDADLGYGLRHLFSDDVGGGYGDRVFADGTNLPVYLGTINGSNWEVWILYPNGGYGTTTYGRTSGIEGTIYIQWPYPK